MEDDSLAQRPRADDELGNLEEFHDSLGHNRAGDELLSAALAHSRDQRPLLGRQITAGEEVGRGDEKPIRTIRGIDAPEIACWVLAARTADEEHLGAG